MRLILHAMTILHVCLQVFEIHFHVGDIEHIIFRRYSQLKSAHGQVRIVVLHFLLIFVLLTPLLPVGFGSEL